MRIIEGIVVSISSWIFLIIALVSSFLMVFVSVFIMVPISLVINQITEEEDRNEY